MIVFQPARRQCQTGGRRLRRIFWLGKAQYPLYPSGRGPSGAAGQNGVRPSGRSRPAVVSGGYSVKLAVLLTALDISAGGERRQP
jgi:hypothetical protein